MIRLVACIILATMVVSCGGGTNTIRTTDVLQFKKVLEDDQLAVKVTTDDGREIMLGDALVTDKGVIRASVNEGDEGFDLELTLDDAEQIRMNRFWERREEREVAVFIDGTFWGLIDGSVLTKKGKILLKNVSQNEEDASALADRITLWKQNKKKSRGERE